MISYRHSSRDRRRTVDGRFTHHEMNENMISYRAETADGPRTGDVHLRGLITLELQRNFHRSKETARIGDSSGNGTWIGILGNQVAMAIGLELLHPRLPCIHGDCGLGSQVATANGRNIGQSNGNGN